ncbi:MAG: hypothetical protein ABIF71_04100 [Planctomycetota bacterium]
MVREERMTNRERIAAVMAGRDVDRFPVWLKMANTTWRNSRPEPYKSMSDVDLLRACGCDPMIGLGVRLKHTAPHVTRRTDEKDGVRTTTIDTPDGPLTGREVVAGLKAL